jgi:hypothetical protein
MEGIGVNIDISLLSVAEATVASLNCKNTLEEVLSVWQAVGGFV